MSDTTTTTSSDPRPVSALEQTLRDKAGRFELYNDDESWATGMRDAADLVHEQDRQLFAYLEHIDKPTAWELHGVPSDRFEQGRVTGERMVVARIRAILEGRTQP